MGDLKRTKIDFDPPPLPLLLADGQPRSNDRDLPEQETREKRDVIELCSLAICALWYRCKGFRRKR